MVKRNLWGKEKYTQKTGGTKSVGTVQPKEVKVDTSTAKPEGKQEQKTKKKVCLMKRKKKRYLNLGRKKLKNGTLNHSEKCGYCY